MPEAGAYADIHWATHIPGYYHLAGPSGIGTVGPGPTTAFYPAWPYGSFGGATLPAHTLISIEYFDFNSDARAGFKTDCTTGEVVDIWSTTGAGPVPGLDMVPIPDTAVVGSFVATTQVYFAPEAGATSDIVMEAGKTAWVYGVDASGAFYQVMLSGQFFWVPVETMGPNYDEVWNGTPLPTGVVE